MEKTYKHAVVLGKFLPPHKGHFWLFKKALERSEKLTILVCALDDIVVEGKVFIKREQIPGWQRQSWIRDHYKDDPRVEVVLVTEENPQTPDDHGYFWNIWKDTIRRNAARADVIFTSEAYGNQLSQILNIPHEAVDGHRFKYRVSGRDIISNPLENWSYIPEHITPYFTKKVALVGPESVGKTQTCKNLSNSLGIPWIPEFGREYVEEYLEVDGPITPLDIAMISAGHQTKIWEACKGHKFVLMDTEAITTHLWCEFYCGSGSTPTAVIKRAWEEEIDLYLGLLPTVEWIDDGTRKWSNQEDRDRFMDMFMNFLDKKGSTYRLINSSSFEEREETITNKIGYFFGRYPGGSQSHE